MEQPNLSQAKESARAIADIAFSNNSKITSESTYINIDDNLVTQRYVFVNGVRLPLIIGDYFITSLKAIIEA